MSGGWGSHGSLLRRRLLLGGNRLLGLLIHGLEARRIEPRAKRVELECVDASLETRVLVGQVEALRLELGRLQLEPTHAALEVTADPAGCPAAPQTPSEE